MESIVAWDHGDTLFGSHEASPIQTNTAEQRLPSRIDATTLAEADNTSLAANEYSSVTDFDNDKSTTTKTDYDNDKPIMFKTDSEQRQVNSQFKTGFDNDKPAGNSQDRLRQRCQLVTIKTDGQRCQLQVTKTDYDNGQLQIQD